MKKEKPNKNGNGHTTQRIRIEFIHPQASAVAIAGTFNNWRPDSAQMMQVGGGRWVKDLALSPGTYEYRIVVDGVWMADPRSQATAPNPFGDLNSVLVVSASKR